MPKGETVDNLLDRTALSLEDVAKAAQVTRRTLFTARKGRTVSRATIVKLAGFLRVPVARLRAAIAASRVAAG